MGVKFQFRFLLVLLACGAALSAPNRKCSLKSVVADIFFVMDGSWMFGKDEYNMVKQYVSNFVSNFTVGPTKTQFAPVEFGGPAVAFSLGNCDDVACVQKMIKGMSWLGGPDDMWIGFSSVMNFAKEKYGFRPKAKHAAILFSNGQFDGSDPVKYANRLREKDIEVLAIGIGRDIIPLDMAKLKEVAGDADNALNVGSKVTSELLSKKADVWLQDKICNL